MDSATPLELGAPTCLHAALGGDVSVSITSNGVYLGHQGLGTGDSDGGVWLMSHALPNGDVTMDDPWTPAIGGSEPFPERGSGGVDHGWLMNVDARRVAAGSDQVSAAWEWSQNALTYLPDHEARAAMFNIDGTLRWRLTRGLATAEVALEPGVYQVSATARVGPLPSSASSAPSYDDPLVPPGTGDVGASGEVVVEQGTWGVDVGSDSGSIPEPPGPWDDLLPSGRVDVFYFEVEFLEEASTVRFYHEAFTLDGARLPSAAVVVPHG